MLNEAFHVPALLSCFACRILMTCGDILLLIQNYQGLKQYKLLIFMNNYFSIFVSSLSFWLLNIYTCLTARWPMGKKTESDVLLPFWGCGYMLEISVWINGIEYLSAFDGQLSRFLSCMMTQRVVFGTPSWQWVVSNPFTVAVILHAYKRRHLQKKPHLTLANSSIKGSNNNENKNNKLNSYSTNIMQIKVF